MNLTFCGYLSILLMLFMVVRCKFRIYMLPTMPLFMITVAYWNFFSRYKTLDLLFEVDVILLYSFICFLVSYAIGKHLKVKRLENNINGLVDSFTITGEYFIKPRVINVYLLIVVIYCIYDLWINTLLYGSLESALIRFYGKPVESDLPSMLKTTLQFLSRGVVVFLFVFRFFLNKYNQSSKTIYIAVFLLMLISFPRGSRGALLGPFLMLLTADIFSVTYQKGFSFFRNMKQYLLIGGSGLALALVLTMIRNVDFEDLSQAYEALQEVKLDSAASKYEESEGELILAEVQNCYTCFGKQVPFLSPFYSLGTIVFGPIPRALWPSKPISFGYVLDGVKRNGKIESPEYFNMNGAVGWAAGYAGEGWANGGVVGVTLYSVLFGLLSGVCAKLYYILFRKGTPVSILLALLFFTIATGSQRGDLLAAVALTVYPLLLIIFVLVGIKKMSRFTFFITRKSN